MFHNEGGNMILQATGKAIHRTAKITVCAALLLLLLAAPARAAKYTVTAAQIPCAGLLQAG